MGVRKDFNISIQRMTYNLFVVNGLKLNYLELINWVGFLISDDLEDEN